ncbi:hypothetical protein HDU86_004467 [Geranomyces michiganensis]|nr:hypothetical protein HDU86_004467 [Geranomyces michiganensis]
MRSPELVASAAENLAGPFASSLPGTPSSTSAVINQLQQHQARRAPITPAQLEAAYARITPTRIGKPPVRLPLPVPKKPAEPEPKSPLELRPPWNGDFHVDRKDFSKPKLPQPSNTQPPRPEFWGSPLAAAAAEPNAGTRSGLLTPSKLPQPSSVLRSPSMSNMKAQTPRIETTTAAMTLSSPPSVSLSPTPTAAGGPRYMRARDPTAETLHAEVEAARKRIRELESQVTHEQQRRKDAEAEFMKNEAEILKAWESEFDQRTALARELETSQALFAEVKQSVTEMALELDWIRDDLEVVESVLTGEQRQAVAAELGRRAAKDSAGVSEEDVLVGRIERNEKENDEIDALRRRVEELRGEI